MQLKLKNLFVMLSVMFVLVGTITAIMTWANLLPSQSFFNTWVSSFLFTFIILLPIGGIIFVTLNKLINLYFSAWADVQKNLLQGVLMAIIMESIMAIILTINNGGYESLTQFSQLFFNSLFYALPVGLTFALTMTLVIKPRIQAYLANVPA